MQLLTNLSTYLSVQPTKMVSSDLKTSMILAGRGARACDMCGKERAKWYCAADEAYLCERCDGSVHSANAVARRHERVRLGPNGAPVKLKPSHKRDRKVKPNASIPIENSVPTCGPLNGDAQKWYKTSRKRSRTLRRGTSASGQPPINFTPSVNHMQPGSPMITKEEKDDTNLLLYDLLAADDQLHDELPGIALFESKMGLLGPPSTLTSSECSEAKVEENDFTLEVPTYKPKLQEIADSREEFIEKLKPLPPSPYIGRCVGRTSKLIETPTDPPCKEVKLGKTRLDVDAEPLHMQELGDSNTGDIDINEGVLLSEGSDIDMFDVMDLCSGANTDVKVKSDEVKNESPDMEMWKSVYRLDRGACASFFAGNPFKGEVQRDLELVCIDVDDLEDEELTPVQRFPQQCSFKRPLSLRLDYEDVMNEWSDRGSFWMDGQKPQIVPDINFLEHGSVECGMAMAGEFNYNMSMSCQAGQVPSLVVVDKDREARVLRYKEKRRTRLFSKRIRYEVRKLNAERRPRMKGRFVKRASIAAFAAL